MEKNKQLSANQSHIELRVFKAYQKDVLHAQKIIMKPCKF